MSRVVGMILLIGALSACEPAPAATTAKTPTPAPSVAVVTPPPAIVLTVNYLDQAGSHYIVWVDVTNRGTAPATGQPLISLYWKQLSIGTLCGPAFSVAPGASTLVKFERLNGPAALFDHEDVALVASC